MRRSSQKKAKKADVKAMLRNRYDYLAGGMSDRRRPSLGVKSQYVVPEAAKEQFRHRPYSLKGDRDNGAEGMGI